MDRFPEPITNAINSRFWAGLSENKFLIQQCKACEHYNYPPRPACPVCNSNLEWKEAEGSGNVYTYGVVHRPNVPEVFEKDVPILLAVIELDEGPRVVTNIIDADADAVTIGATVEIVYEHLDTGVFVPKARLVSD